MPTVSSATRALAPLFSLVIALFAASCGGEHGGHPGGPGGPGGMPPSPVAVQEVQPHDVPVDFEYPAQTAGSREAEVRPRVSGILLKRNYEEGAMVKEGESLFSIDAAPYESAVSRAEADVSAAEARSATRSAPSRSSRRTPPRRRIWTMP